MTDLVILGASGHGREVADVVVAAARGESRWRTPLCFLDDDPALHGSRVGGLVVHGCTTSAKAGVQALLGVGYPEVKHRVLESVRDRGYVWPVLCHPGAELGSRVSLARGCFIQSGCVITCDVTLGEFVTLNVGTTLNHDVEVGRLVTLSPGSRVGGSVQIGEGAFLGIGAVVRQGVRIGPWSVVGAGAVVVKDVPANCVVAGVPARVIEQREDGWFRVQ